MEIYDFFRVIQLTGIKTRTGEKQRQGALTSFFLYDP